jgi:hypothetical protein
MTSPRPTTMTASSNAGTTTTRRGKEPSSRGTGAYRLSSSTFTPSSSKTSSFKSTWRPKEMSKTPNFCRCFTTSSRKPSRWAASTTGQSTSLKASSVRTKYTARLSTPKSQPKSAPKLKKRLKHTPYTSLKKLPTMRDLSTPSGRSRDFRLS